MTSALVNFALPSTVPVDSTILVHRELERFAALHVNQMHLCVDRRVIERLAPSATLCVEQFGAASVGAEIRCEEGIFRAALQNHGPRAVAEKYRRRTIVFIEYLRQRLGADQHDAA